jgi:hypothetical protein
MKIIYNIRKPRKNMRLPWKKPRQLNGTVTQAWRWANAAHERKLKQFRYGLTSFYTIDTWQGFLYNRGIKTNNKAVPLCMYGWKLGRNI